MKYSFFLNAIILASLTILSLSSNAEVAHTTPSSTAAPDSPIAVALPPYPTSSLAPAPTPASPVSQVDAISATATEFNLCGVVTGIIDFAPHKLVSVQGDSAKASYSYLSSENSNLTKLLLNY